MSILTIAIPTYNRNEILKKNIKFLLPQLNHNCFLLILDNHSTIPVSETLTSELIEYAHLQIKIIRNRSNIGGNANIVRCFELCDTDWLWVLGDDDLPQEDAIKTIFSDIKKYPELLSINYYSPSNLHPVRRKTKLVCGIDEYFDNIDYFGSMIFISSNIYHAKSVIHNLGYAMFYQYTCVPQFIILILSLKDSIKSLISDKIIVNNGSDSTPQQDQISPLPVANGLPALMTLPISYRNKKILRKKLASITKDWITPEGVVYNLLLEWRNNNDRKDIQMKYKSIRKNLFSFSINPMLQCKYWLYKFLLDFPEIGFALITLILSRRRANTKEVPATIKRQI